MLGIVDDPTNVVAQAGHGSRYRLVQLQCLE